MLRIFRKDDGVVAIIVALTLVLLFTFAALAVDLGLWFTARRQLQSAADAAALAGCRQLAQGASNAAIWQTVTDYATRNFTVPVASADTTVMPLSAGGLSDIGSDYVKVTVRTMAPSFFARVFGQNEGEVAAQAVARIGYLAGGRGPVPWGLSVLHVGNMSATMGGQTIEMWDAGNSRWNGGFSAGLYGPVTVRATNDSGYTEQFPGVVTVGHLPATGRIAAVELEKTTFTSGVDSTCRIEVSLTTTLAAGEQVAASSNGATPIALVLDPATGRYVGHVQIPTTVDPFIRVPIVVEVGPRNRPVQTASCSVLVRRANYILLDVEAQPAFVRPGDNVVLSVRTLEFEFGTQYQIKVEGGTGSTGNFLSLDFAAASLNHSQCGFPDTPVSPGGHGGSDYADYIVGDPNLVVHVNDLVETKTGNMAGPTQQGIGERLQGVTLVSFDQWVAAGRPETKQILLVPITEKIEDLTGKSLLRIVSFATFFLEQPPRGSQDAVVGRFIEYTAPGWVVSPTPPGPLAVRAVHLVSDHLDF